MIRSWKGGPTVLIIVNEHLPQKAKSALARLGETVDFSAPGIVYDAICAHPDIFFAMIGDKMIVAPNLPLQYTRLLSERKISHAQGQTPVGYRYPGSARYNAVITEKYFIHNLSISDPLLLEKAVGREKIHVNQGYTRCNLLTLGNTHFVTSDKGICHTLEGMHFQVLYVDPENILLQGFSHGFFGGACGVWQQTVFISGSLTHHPQGETIRQFINSAGFTVEELYDGPLFDGGSIVFIS